MDTQPPDANSLAHRSSYKPSGGLNVAVFALLLILALTMALALAGIMFWLYYVGHYYLFLVPFIAALAVAGMARLAVVKGHCRYSLVATAAGLILGAALYLGSYEAGVLYHWGPEAAANPGRLLDYIQFRLRTDVTHDSNEGATKKSLRRGGSFTMNSIWSGFEFLLVLVVTTSTAYRFSRKPYCERCHRWLKRESTTFEADKVTDIVTALRDGSPRSLAAVCVTPPYSSIPNTMLAVDYCPSMKEGTSRDCLAFLSLKTISENAKGMVPGNYEQAKGKVIAREVALNPDEIPALAPRFPVFETYAGRAAVTALLPKIEPFSNLAQAQRETSCLEFMPLGSERCRKVLTRKMKWLGNASASILLLAFLGGPALLLWGLSILDRSRDGVLTHQTGIVVCTVGGIFILVGLLGLLIDPSMGATRRLRKKLQAEISTRTDVLVDPYDPEAVFVEVVPKANWGKMMLDNASDIGLLLVDKRRKEIRFEGDAERWRAPAKCILSYELDFYTQGHGAGAQTMYFALLRVAKRDGYWEVPVRERSVLGLLTAQKKKRALKLLSAIKEIAGEERRDPEWAGA